MAIRLPVLRPRPVEPPVEPAPGQPAPPRPSWRRLLRQLRTRNVLDGLRRNKGLKLVSLVLAFLLWFSINVSERDAERELRLPLAVRRMQADLIVTNLPPSPVLVRVHGPRTILEGVDTSQTRVALDMARFGPGEQTIELNPDMVRPELPRRLKVTRVEPTRVKLQIERLVPRRLPVRVDVAGMPPLGYTVVRTTVTPAEVEASGPAQRVDDLKEIKTEPIDVTGLTQTTRRDDVLLSWAGDFVTFAPDHVRVEVAVEQVMMSREFPRVEVRVLNAENMRTQLSPAHVDLTVSGPQRLLHNYRLKPDAVTVDAAGLKQGDHQVTVRVDLPPALTVTARRPEEHRLRITAGRGGR